MPISLKHKIISFEGTRADWEYLADRLEIDGETRLAQTIRNGLNKNFYTWRDGTRGPRGDPADWISLRFRGGSGDKLEKISREDWKAEFGTTV